MDLGVSRKRICNFLLVIVILDVLRTIIDILTHKAGKPIFFPTPALFDAPIRLNPLEFPDETYPAKTRGQCYDTIRNNVD